MGAGSIPDEAGIYDHCLELVHNLYRSTNRVRVIKPVRLKWAGLVARMEEGRSDLKILTD